VLSGRVAQRLLACSGPPASSRQHCGVCQPGRSAVTTVFPRPGRSEATRRAVALTRRWPGSPQLWLVLAAVAWQLWTWRAERLQVSYLYDASVHLEMARFAAATVEAGHDPFSSWFPYVGLGSPQYSQYQSLASVLTGLAGVGVGAGNAFRWSLYLLVAFWPLAVYASARLLGLSRGAAAAAAVLAPFVVSFTGTGFEQNAYSYIGGAELWTQLFGSWALAFAWASSWRAFSDRRYLWLAAGLCGLTIALHFECGYLALLGVMVMALAGRGSLLQRLERGAVLLAGSLAAAAWVIVPLMAYSKWSAINEALAPTDYVRGYGAAKELGWLFTGQLFDARRSVPVISALVAAGALVALAGWRRRVLERSLLALLAASLVLSFGPTTFGPLSVLVPAHKDLFFRRFTMGAQLAGLYLGGTVVPMAWRLLASIGGSVPERLGRFSAPGWLRRGRGEPGGERCLLSVPPARICLGVLGAAVAGAWLYPAAAQLYRFDRADAAAIHDQRAADAQAGAELAPIVSYLQRHGGGRVYAGLSGNWGSDFLVGSVPVYKYLLQHGVEEMAYVVPSMSLMLGPEGEFDEAQLSDYGLFGVRYLLLPSGAGPPVPARFVMARGPYSLWQVPSVGYLEPVELTGQLAANRADVGSASLAMLESLPPGQDWSVDWAGAGTSGPTTAAALTNPNGGGHRHSGGTAGHDGRRLSELAAAGDKPGGASGTSPAAGLGPAGKVLSWRAELVRGTLSATVHMARAGDLLLAVAYNPGWQAWVDGRRAVTQMLAPALVGVHLDAGTHRVVFRYVGFGWYAELWAASGLTLVVLAQLGRRRRSAPQLPTGGG